MTTMTLEEANSIRLKQGEFFGYPKCCVNSFIRYMSGKGKRTPLQNKMSHPEGFIPCNKHAKRIHMREIDISDLIDTKKRVCSVAFATNISYDYYIEIKKSDEFKEWIKI
jgi:hypothetical protein